MNNGVFWKRESRPIKWRPCRLSTRQLFFCLHIHPWAHVNHSKKELEPPCLDAQNKTEQSSVDYGYKYKSPVIGDIFELLLLNNSELLRVWAWDQFLFCCSHRHPANSRTQPQPRKGKYLIPMVLYQPSSWMESTPSRQAIVNNCVVPVIPYRCTSHKSVYLLQSYYYYYYGTDVRCCPYRSAPWNTASARVRTRNCSFWSIRAPPMLEITKLCSEKLPE